MVTITKRNIVAGVFETLYDILNAEVTDPNPSAPRKWWFTTFPDKKTSSRNDYPLGIIDPASYSWQPFKLQQTFALVDVDVNIFSTKAEEADKLMDEILDILESNRGKALRDASMYNYKVTSVINRPIRHGNILLHARTASINFRIPFKESY